MNATNEIHTHMGNTAVGRAAKTVQCAQDATSKNALDVKAGTYCPTAGHETKT